MARVIYGRIVDKLESQRREIVVPLRLPEERILAKDFAVGRDTVRRALSELAKSGAVTRYRGRGTFLHPSGGNFVGDLRGCHVGLVPPWWADSTSAWFTSTVFEGLARWADEQECQISVLHADRHSKKEAEWIGSLSSRKIAGIVWVHPASEQLPLMEHTARLLPSVVLGRHYPNRGLHHVMPDYNQVVDMIDSYLVSKGHKNYAVVGASVQAAYSQSWLEALDKTLGRRGAKFDQKQHFVDIKPFIREKLARLLLDFYQPIHDEVQSYVLTSSSYLSPLIGDEEFRNRLREDLSVVAFDFGLYPMSSYWPGHDVTHVACNWPKIGRRAMEMLALLAAEEDVPEMVLEPVEFREGTTVHHWRARSKKDGRRLVS